MSSGPRHRRVPEGDNRERLICEECGFIYYENPKVVVGAVCSWQRKILLCRRAIEPGYGLWTVPTGYLELKETPEQGALRETWEEAGARVKADALLAVYTVPRANQVQLFYRARLQEPKFQAGPESLEAQLLGWDQIPWPKIAFPSVVWALRHYQESRGKRVFAPYGNPTY